jgi:hypothetical protein
MSDARRKRRVGANQLFAIDHGGDVMACQIEDNMRLRTGRLHQKRISHY